jgi:hypothetical protein
MQITSKKNSIGKCPKASFIKLVKNSHNDDLNDRLLAHSHTSTCLYHMSQ